MHLGSNYTIWDQLKTKPINSTVGLTINVDANRPTTPSNVTLVSPANKKYYYIKDWTSIPYV